MAEEKKTFVLYEYLLYFWRRKWFFVIIPLIVTILVAGAVYVLKNDKKFTGTALVYTGNVDSKELTNDKLLEGRYQDEKNPPEVKVSESRIVKFTVKGDSKEEVQQDLDNMMQDYSQALQASAKKKIDVTTHLLNPINERVKTLTASLEMYNRKLDEAASVVDNTELTDLITKSDDKLTETTERSYKLSGDIELFEYPKVVTKSVGPSKTYLKESIAIGVILGLVLTVALLMLMKYLFDARRYYNHN